MKSPRETAQRTEVSLRRGDLVLERLDLTLEFLNQFSDFGGRVLRAATRFSGLLVPSWFARFELVAHSEQLLDLL